MATKATTTTTNKNVVTSTTGSTASQTTKDAMAKLLEQAGKSTYTARTQDELKDIATQRYNSTYDAKARAAQQSYDTQALNYDQQMQQKRDDTTAAIDQSNKQYLQNFNTSNRSMLSKGMQRSSYGAAVGAGILNAGAEAAQNIQDTAQKNIDNIAAQKALAGNQLAQTLEGYENDKQNDILAYMDELEEKDYDRSVNADKNAASIYQSLLSASQTQDANDLSQEQFVKQYEQKYGKDYYTGKSTKKTTTSGGKNPTTPSGTDKGGNTDSQIASTLEDYLKANGSTGNSLADYFTIKNRSQLGGSIGTK